jgi:hypothetical protein
MFKSVLNYVSELDRQFLIFVVIVLVAMFSIGQLNDPFIAHDD